VIPDKRAASERGQYLLSARDEAHGRVGSLICRRLAVCADRECVTAVLSLSTYGRQLAEDGDSDSVRKLEAIVLPPFETRIRLELALLYIKRVISAEAA
jgi:hypothetical protein